MQITLVTAIAATVLAVISAIWGITQIIAKIDAMCTRTHITFEYAKKEDYDKHSTGILRIYNKSQHNIEVTNIIYYISSTLSHYTPMKTPELSPELVTDWNKKLEQHLLTKNTCLLTAKTQQDLDTWNNQLKFLQNISDSPTIRNHHLELPIQIQPKTTKTILFQIQQNEAPTCVIVEIGNKLRHVSCTKYREIPKCEHQTKLPTIKG